MPALEDYLSRPLTAPDATALEAIERGPPDSRHAPWPTDRMRKMEGFATGIQLADENLGARPARFVTDENLRRLDEIRAR